MSDPQFRNEKLNQLPYADYEFIGRWKSDAFACYFWADWLDQDLLRDLNFPMPFNGVFILNDGHFFFHKQILRIGEDKLLNIFEKKEYARLKRIKDAAFKSYNDLLEESKQIAELEPNLETLAAAFSIAKRLTTPWCLTNVLSHALDPLIVSTAEKEGVDIADVPRLMPEIESHLLKQQKDMKKLLVLLKDRGLDELLGEQTEKLIEEISADTRLNELFNGHVRTYGWIEMLNFIGEPLTLRRLLEQMHLANKTIRPKIQPLSSKPNETFLQFLEAVTQVSSIRQAGAEYSSIFALQMLPLFKKTAVRLGLAYRQMMHLIPDEIMAGLKGELSCEDLIKIIDGRKGGYWILYHHPETGELVVLDERKAKDDLQKLERLIVPQAPEGKELKGQIGNKGKATGKVRVVMGTDDFSKFNEGEILVTTMTTPDFVVLMQKSAAIVTDIGGLLSHASIVSRELGIPCVIGTKFATQVLKDGDTVEVDADTGTVKVI
jgi:phosphoenolpyruvate synthase/pyruvate phosphate dikinase